MQQPPVTRLARAHLVEAVLPSVMHSYILAKPDASVPHADFLLVGASYIARPPYPCPALFLDVEVECISVSRTGYSYGLLVVQLPSVMTAALVSAAQPTGARRSQGKAFPAAFGCASNTLRLIGPETLQRSGVQPRS